MPQARKLIEGASFGPDALQSIGQAFDEAWASIAANYNTPLQVEAARLKLANLILARAADGSFNVESLTASALQAMASSPKEEQRAQHDKSA